MRKSKNSRKSRKGSRPPTRIGYNGYKQIYVKGKNGKFYWKNDGVYKISYPRKSKEKCKKINRWKNTSLPKFNATACANKRKKGEDGNWYISRRSGNGHVWKKHIPKIKSR